MATAAVVVVEVVVVVVVAVVVVVVVVVVVLVAAVVDAGYRMRDASSAPPKSTLQIFEPRSASVPSHVGSTRICKALMGICEIHIGYIIV